MVKKEGKKKASTLGLGYQHATLREENSGRKNVKGVKGVNSILRMQHLQKLATWAGGKACIPPLGALFGHHLAASTEAMGITLDSSLFPCQRCETILQPGYNCTVRIQKNVARRRHSKKLSIPSQSNVVFTCHFCSHRNLKRGTPKGHMKEIFASRPKFISASKHVGSTDQKFANSDKDRGTSEEIIYLNNNAVSELNSDDSEKDQAIIEIPIENSLVTPIGKSGIALPENRKKSGLGSNKTIGADKSNTATEIGKAGSGSSKRRRKGWSSLKEIAESSECENSRSIGNLTIPFFM